MKKYYQHILMIALVLVLSVGYFVNGKKINTSISNQIPALSSQLITPSEIASNQDESIPSSFSIANVPFQSQAPDANWDQLHDEACEEASIIIAKYYSTGENLSDNVMESEIQKMVTWEINFFGSHKDLTVAETAEMAQKFYDLNFQVMPISSINDIKKEIAQDHLVIVPTAGRLLGNPNFRSPGPIYHMLVISGYDGNTIITQDVGTRNGKNYLYAEKILFNAIHDWNGPNDINSGQKVMLILTN